MAYTTILTDVRDGVMTITLNRPDKLNAFTHEMADELVAAFDDADADDRVGAVIVTGAGRAFCGGMDLSGGASTFDYDAYRGDADGGSPVRADGSVDYSHRAVRDSGGRVTLRIFNCLKPVIGALNGHAVGIGITMTLPMDMRLVAEGAKIGFVFTRRGIVPEAASSWFLPRIVGISRALEWTMSGRLITAEEAREGGLVRSVHAQDDIVAAAETIGRDIIQNTAPVSVALARQMMWRGLGLSHPMEAHRIDSKLIYNRGRTADAAEGVSSFLEKRAAAFPDRVGKDMPELFPWWEEPEYR